MTTAHARTHLYRGRGSLSARPLDDLAAVRISSGAFLIAKKRRNCAAQCSKLILSLLLPENASSVLSERTFRHLEAIEKIEWTPTAPSRRDCSIPDAGVLTSLI